MGDDFAVDAGNRGIVLLDDVQDDAVVGRVLIMMVTLPVGGAHVDFDVAHPQVVVNLHLGVVIAFFCIEVLYDTARLGLKVVGGNVTP